MAESVTYPWPSGLQILESNGRGELDYIDDSDFFPGVLAQPHLFTGSAYNYGKQVGRGFENEAGVVQTLVPGMGGFPEEPGFQGSDRHKEYINKYPAMFHLLGDARSEAEVKHQINFFNETRAEQERLAADPRYGLTTVLASLIEPTTLVPFGIAGPSWGIRFMKSTAALGVSSAATEQFVQAVNPEADKVQAGNLTALTLIIGAPLSATATRPGLFRAAPEPKPSGEFVFAASPVESLASELEKGVRWTEKAEFGESTVGAARAPGSKTKTFEQELHDEGLKEGLFSVERLGWNPVFRLAKSSSIAARNLVSDMVDTGLIFRKNMKGEASGISVERTYREEFVYPMVQLMRQTDDLFLNYRKALLDPEAGDFARQWQIAKIAAGDMRGTAGGLNYRQFREEVTKAIRRGYQHEIPEVQQASLRYKTYFDEMRAKGQEVDLFSRQMRREADILASKKSYLEGQLMKAESEGADVRVTMQLSNEIVEMQEHIAALEYKIDKMTKYGPTVNTADGYVPRYWNRSAIEDRYTEFKDILTRHFMKKEGLDHSAARNAAKETIDNILMDNPVPRAGAEIKFRKEAGSFRERVLDIEDIEVEEFLMNDIEMLMRHQTKEFGVDIVMTRKFGDIEMSAQIRQIEEEYSRQIADAELKGNRNKAVALHKQMLADVRDVKGIRDRLRGTYGVPEDPYRLVSRAARIMKSINVLTMMGGAGVTSMTDVARFVMVQGLSTPLSHAVRVMGKGVEAKHIRKAIRKEIQSAGEALDILLGSRALQMADIADTFASRSGFEDALLGSTNLMFIANGLNYWNTAMKEFAALTTAFEMNKALRRASKGKTLKKDIETLAASGIDSDMAERMWAQIEKHGEDVGQKNFLPNTDEWDDVAAARVYRGALASDVNRIIVTPGAGDRALWTSTEFGSVISQFQGFGQAFVQRALVRGAQAPDAAFYSGMVTLVGLGYLVNELKAAIRGDDSDKPMRDKVIDAVDRSGSLGWFMSASNAVDAVSNGRFGIRGLLGEQPPPNYGGLGQLGDVLGPSASQANNAVRALGGSQSAFARMLPFQNHPLVQGAGTLMESVNPMERPTAPKEN